MATISFIQPLDQPLKHKRLLGELRAALNGNKFDRLYIAVAAVSEGALLRLDKEIKAWRTVGKSIQAIYGVDISATTIEALKYSLDNFNEVYISRIAGVKFHPKMYIFRGPENALLFYGSNNFTVSGTETNFEAAIKIEYELPGEDADFKAALDGWTNLLAETASLTVFPLTTATLAHLMAEGFAISEKELGKSSEGGKGISKAPVGSALPKSTLKKYPPALCRHRPSFRHISRDRSQRSLLWLLQRPT